MAESENQAVSPQIPGNSFKGDASSGTSGSVPQGADTNSGFADGMPMTDNKASATVNHDNDRLQNNKIHEDPNANLQPGNAHSERFSGANESTNRSKSPHPRSPNCLPGDDTPNRPTRRHYTQKSRTEMSTLWKEREERVKKMKEQQEEDRRRKAEEWQHQALLSQKFREQQEYERKKALLDARAKDTERRNQIEERRKALEKADKERREALMGRNMEREERLDSRRKSSTKLTFAFGSSTPRMVEPGEPGAKRSTSSSNVHGNLMTQSMYVRRSTEREAPDGRLKSNAKKSTSVYGLDKSGHEGLSREGTASSRLSSTPSETKSGVRMRTSGSRKPRPASIAVSGMSQSMYEKRSSGALSGATTPTNPRQAKNLPLDSKKKVGDREEDAKSTTSSASSIKTPNRKTPAQVKAISAAKKNSKVAKSPVTNASKTKSPVSEAPIVTVVDASDEKEPLVKREATPDILTKSEKTNQDPDVTENTENSVSEDHVQEAENKAEVERPVQHVEAVEGEGLATPVKKIITSEEEAKARIAEKRREVKEKKEREAELERQRLAEEERLEKERLAREEEEERKAMEEAERLAAEARKAEEERLQRAIEEAQRREEEERKRKEEEERLKLEAQTKAREEAERKQIELEDKLRKEEEERQERRKKLELIMARTRSGKKGAILNTPTKSGSGDEKVPETPEKEAVVESNGDSTNNLVNVEVAGHTEKPDIIGDINGQKTQETPLRNDYDPFSSSKDQLEQVKGSDQVFDQILDLSSETNVKPSDQESQNSVIIGAPIIAFEDANSGLSAKQEVPTADLLS